MAENRVLRLPNPYADEDAIDVLAQWAPIISGPELVLDLGDGSDSDFELAARNLLGPRARVGSP